MKEEKEKEIYYQLALEQFKNVEIDMAKSEEACHKIAKKYKLGKDEIYRILGKGVFQKWETPEYLENDWSKKHDIR